MEDGAVPSRGTKIKKMTLESQYKSYLKENPESNYTFDEWMEKVMKPFVTDTANQIENLMKKENKED